MMQGDMRKGAIMAVALGFLVSQELVRPEARVRQVCDLFDADRGAERRYETRWAHLLRMPMPQSMYCRFSVIEREVLHLPIQCSHW